MTRLGRLVLTAVGAVVFWGAASSALAQPSLGTANEMPPTSSGEQAGQAPRDTDDTETTDMDAGGDFGYTRLDDLNYAAPTLSADVRLAFFQTAIRIPLRLDVASGAIRKRDWDETGDFFRVGQCVRIDYSNADTFERERGLCLPWQVPRDDYYFTLRLGPLEDMTIGHGTLLTSYSNNLNPDHFHPGMLMQYQFHQFVVGTAFMDNAVDPTLVAGTFALRPFAYENEETDDEYESRHQFQLQATAISDLAAPRQVRTAFGQALYDNTRNLLFTTTQVTAIGADFEYKYVFGTQIEAEFHFDWNYLTGYGMGTHAQLWFNYNHPDGDYTFRGSGEFRYVESNYIPNYFDSYYEIQRQQFSLQQAGEFRTKFQQLQGLPSDSWDAGYQIGLYFEAFSGEGDERRSVVNARLTLGDTIGRGNDGQFTLTVQVPRLADKIDIYGIYSRQNFDDLVDIFTLDNTLVKLLVRWDLNDMIYVLMNYGRLWQLGSTRSATGEEVVDYQSNNTFNISLGFAQDL